MKYRKLPVVIDALQLDWSTWGEMCDFVPMEGSDCVGVYVNPDDETDWSVDNKWDDQIIGLLIPTLEGVMLARQGDYVICGVNGEFYPCKPDIFEKTYEKVE